MNKLVLIIPVFNEQEVLEYSSYEFIRVIQNLIKKQKISKDSKIVFIDDGSFDSSWNLIEKLIQKESYINGIKLSRNYGQQSAMLAGLFNIEADMYITVDVDLQEDINAIELMINEYLNNNDIVYGVREKREEDTFFKKFSAEIFYKLMLLLGINIISNHSEYRLMSKRAVESLKLFPEKNLFLKGIIPLLGYPTAKVYYSRKKRVAGDSKYPFKKLLSLAWEGITSFSVIPLKIITFIGFILFIVSLILGGWAFYMKLFTDTAVPGWASTVIPIYFIGGIQVLSLGIIGEYIGKIYKETKQRPYFLIDKIIEKKKD